MKRFWDKVNIKDKDECWEWIGAKNSVGRGVFYLNGSVINASRASWIITYGDIDNEIVCHKCDNLLCVNPNHLYLGNHCDNASDRTSRNPTPPEICGYSRSKLYSDEIWLIRKLLKLDRCTQRDIADTFNVSQWVIYNINKQEKVLCKEGYYI